MKPNLTPSQQDRILELALFLESVGADQGVEMSNADIGKAIGWNEPAVCQTKRLIAEHPELSLGITSRRGRRPRVTFSSTEQRLVGDSVTEVEHVGRSAFYELCGRAGRQAANKFAEYRNTADKRTAKAKRLLSQCRQWRLLVSQMQGILSLDDPRDEEVSEFFDRILAEFPG